MKRRFVLSVTQAFILAGLLVRPALAHPPVWMMPPADDNGASLRALFENPQSWRKTRTRIDGLGYADHWLDHQFSDAELRAWLPRIRGWGLKFGLEVGALKPWGRTAEAAFAVDRRHWDRFIADGGHIDSLAMDEPLGAAMIQLHLGEDDAVTQTARFVALVRRHYPGLRIGDIEPYPYFSGAQLLGFFDAVQTRLHQMGVRGLDFVRLDVNWPRFARDEEAGWRGVRALEGACHQRGLPFQLIYWAAEVPKLQREGALNDMSWEDGIMREGAAYQRAGGRPDAYVIESWVQAPPHAVPENAAGTFTRSVLDFTNAFVPGDAADAETP